MEQKKRHVAVHKRRNSKETGLKLPKTDNEIQGQHDVWKNKKRNVKVLCL